MTDKLLFLFSFSVTLRIETSSCLTADALPRAHGRETEIQINALHFLITFSFLTWKIKPHRFHVDAYVSRTRSAAQEDTPQTHRLKRAKNKRQKRRWREKERERERDGSGRDCGELREPHLVKGLRAEWCWMCGDERWRGCGRDRAPGAGKTRRASRRRCLIPSSAVRALPNQYLEREKSCGGALVMPLHHRNQALFKVNRFFPVYDFAPCPPIRTLFHVGKKKNHLGIFWRRIYLLSANIENRCFGCKCEKKIKNRFDRRKKNPVKNQE